ncbi:DDE superfamily endonuclease [Popillia japonica]|uniref:DDE superfamily endonuclease n=1 Tax=Popillia japonica TaxID=7064 RepID=A0AAW1IG20_POPJA
MVCTMNNEKATAIFTIVSELIESDEDIEIIINISDSKTKRKRLAIDNYVNNVALMYNPDDFKSHFRLRRDTFEQLLETLGPFLRASNPMGIGRPTHTIEKQLLITLSMLSSQNVFRCIAEQYNVSKSTAWLYVHKICEILIAEQYNVSKSTAWLQGFTNVIGAVDGSHIPITPPKKQQKAYFKPTGIEVFKTMSEFQKRQGFTNVIGAVDGSHIPITPPKKQQKAYFNRNKYHSIILQAVCNANYIFTDVFAGFPGSAHDARVFRNSDLGKKLQENPAAVCPHNSHILADSAYRNTNYVLTPFRDNGHLTHCKNNIIINIQQLEYT